MSKNDDLGKELAASVAKALNDIPVWTCPTCGCQNYRERCQRCFAPKPKGSKVENLDK